MVHNEVLRRLVETGIVGTVTYYIAVMFVLFRGLVSSLSSHSRIAVVLAVAMIAALFASQFYPGTKPEFLWLICGLLVGIDHYSHAEHKLGEGARSNS
jgi:O-antigen ligase